MSKQSDKIDALMLEQLQLVTRIKGFNIDNFHAMSRRTGIPTEQLVALTLDHTTPYTVVQTKLRHRIEESEKLQLSSSYVNGLKDAYKLLFNARSKETDK